MSISAKTYFSQLIIGLWLNMSQVGTYNEKLYKESIMTSIKPPRSLPPQLSFIFSLQMNTTHQIISMEN